MAYIIVLTVAMIVGGVFLLRSISTPPKRRKPPQINGVVPYISTTIQFVTDAGTLINRVAEISRETGSNIVKFYIGWTPTYIVTGAKNVQKVLNSPESLDGTFLQLVLMKSHWDLSPYELNLFRTDKSGRSSSPANGVENTPETKRYWYGHDRLFAKYLSPRKCSDALAASFYTLFSERLERRSGSTETTVQVLEFLKDAMAESAIISLFGSRLIDLNPGIVDLYWAFDEVAGPLAFGPPKLFQRRSVQIRNKLHAMIDKQIESAWQDFDWNGPDAESDWEPLFGSRLSRETAKWLRDNGFSDHAAAGHTLASLFGLNGNTVPLTAWMLIELIKDPSLLAAVREESMSVMLINEETGIRHIDAQRLTNLPLMQSLYIEIMRLHVSFNPMRQAVRDLDIDDYTIEKGALVQTCSQIAHQEEAVWGVKGHPASKFWAWRHLKSVDKIGNPKAQQQFSMAARPSSFFPYGGGYVMCPGRHFAKQEILLTVATIITKLDLEFIEWTTVDGSPSDRPPNDDRSFAGFIATPPDRDVRIRWKRMDTN